MPAKEKIKKMNYANLSRSTEAFKALMQTHSVPGEKEGIIDFHYQDFIDAADGKLNSKSEVSLLLQSLQLHGLIKRLRRGGALGPSRWDVSTLLNIDIENYAKSEQYKALSNKVGRRGRPMGSKNKPKHTNTEVSKRNAPEQEEAAVTLEVVKSPEETAPAVNVTEVTEEVSVSDVYSEVSAMLEYLKVMPNQMVDSLNEMLSKLATHSPQYVQGLEERVSELQSERNLLRGKLEIATIKLSEQKHEALNVHGLYRLRNKILDEIERYIATPGWKRSNSTENFRQTITRNLDEMMREIGVDEDAKTESFV